MEIGDYFTSAPATVVLPVTGLIICAGGFLISDGLGICLMASDRLSWMGMGWY